MNQIKPTRSIPRWTFDWLGGELETWVRDGLIEPRQAEEIKGRYQVETARDSGRLIAVFSTLGAILVGVGVICFFAANWQGIPKGAKLVLIFGGILGVYGWGYYLRFHKAAYPRAAEALILLGALFYGAAIWLIAQIFNINAHYPNGVLTWAVGILPLAWATSSAPVLCLASILFTVWTVLESVNFSSWNPLYVAMMLAFVVPLCYRISSAPALAVTLVGLNYWFGAYLHFLGIKSVLLIYPAAGVFMCAAGLAHAAREETQGMAPAYSILGLITMLLSTFLLTFRSILGEFHTLCKTFAARIGSHEEMFVIYGAALAMIGIAFLATRRSKGGAEARTGFELSVLGGGWVLGFVALLVLGAPKLEGLLVGVINVGFFALTIGLIYGGYRSRHLIAVNLGTLSFVALLVARYFDCLWGLMPQSLFFIGGGVLLLILGTFMERRRRAIVQEIRGGKG